jgi:lambda family phage portal protein
MADILDQFGRPIRSKKTSRAGALINGGVTAFDAADRLSPEMAGWNPYLGGPDTEIDFYRDISVARIRDLVRNDGWASGAITRIVDAAVGADFRMASRPDYRALARRFGGAFDPVWAREFAAAAEAAWRTWGHDPRVYCDIERRMTFAQLARLAFRHYCVEGEAIAVLPWRPDRVGYGRADYATAVQLIDPDRLSNPQLTFDTLTMRGGVEIDPDGAPIAYHFREAHMNDWWAAGKSAKWDRIPRETDWGRPMVVHFFDADRAGQHRPIGGVFYPILARMRMLAQYDRVEVQAAMVNAIFGAYITSPFDPKDVQDALDEGEDDTIGRLSRYQEMRSEFHRDRRLMAGDVRMPTLYPGESINTVMSSRPAAAFEAFEGAMLRNFATALGSSYETVSSDYRGSSYSSARQASIEAWRTLNRRRHDFGRAFCTPIYSALLEEAFENGELPLPAGAPDFVEATGAYCRCRWMGPGRGWVDPTKEPEGSRMKIASGLSTLEAEVAENSGLDWEEVLDQIELERKEIERRGLDLIFDPTEAQMQPKQQAEEQAE